MLSWLYWQFLGVLHFPQRTTNDDECRYDSRYLGERGDDNLDRVRIHHEKDELHDDCEQVYYTSINHEQHGQIEFLGVSPSSARWGIPERPLHVPYASGDERRGKDVGRY